MQPVYQAALRSWSIPPVATFALVLTALVYLARMDGCFAAPACRSFRPGELGLPGLGLFSLWVALASPLDTFSGFVLDRAHAAAHDADDGGAAAHLAGCAAHSHRARFAALRRPRIRRALS